MSKEQILNLFAALSIEEQQQTLVALIEEQRAARQKTDAISGMSATVPQRAGLRVFGNRVSITSIKTASQAQRALFLTNVAACNEERIGDLLVNRVSHIKDVPDSFCLYHSDMIAVPKRTRQTLDISAHPILGRLINNPIAAQRCNSGDLVHLPRSLNMRLQPRFDKIPIDEHGCFQIKPPHYPGKLLTTYFLPCTPWARLFAAAKLKHSAVSWLVDNEPPYFVIGDAFKLIVTRLFKTSLIS